MDVQCSLCYEEDGKNQLFPQLWIATHKRGWAIYRCYDIIVISIFTIIIIIITSILAYRDNRANNNTATTVDTVSKKKTTASYAM